MLFKAVLTNPHCKTNFRILSRFNRLENLNLLAVFKPALCCLKFIHGPPTTNTWQLTPPLAATMHGLPPSRLLGKSLHPPSTTFSPLFHSDATDVEDYLRRQTRKRLMGLVAPHLVEIGAQEVAGGLPKERRWCKWVLRGLTGPGAFLKSRRRGGKWSESEVEEEEFHGTADAEGEVGMGNTGERGTDY